MKTKIIKDEIKNYFFVNPTAKLRVRQIERELKLPLPSVIRYTKELEKEEILKKENIGGIVLFSANRSSINFLIEKKMFNIKQIYCSGLIDNFVKEYFNPTIVLFGSFSKGEDLDDSDIDLYIETPSKKDINLNRFEKILKRKIQIFKYNHIRQITNVHLANNIINGIVLNGFLEVLK